MQDKYVGDVGDFGKYILLNTIVEHSDHGVILGVNWYYVQRDEGANTDGNHTDYLTKANESSVSYENCSPLLYSKLATIVDHNRRLSEIENARVLAPETLFHRKPIPIPRHNGDSRSRREREEWYEASKRKLYEADIIFVDPDNGIQPIRTRKDQVVSIKYAFYDEIEQYYRLGKSVIIYNHRDRRPQEEYEAKIILTRRIVGSWNSIKVVRFKRVSVRDYVFLVQPKHRPLIDRVIKSLTSSPLEFLFEEYPLLSERPAVSENKWTNPSVILFAGKSEPTSRMRERARELVINAIDKGWEGPPYNPFQLAEIRGIEVIPNQGVLDAQTIPTPRGKGRIEYNPNRSKGRINFSIAHEIAHMMFPDWHEMTRQRHRRSSRMDDRQLEVLCNIAAAEILMPIGTGEMIEARELNVENIIELQGTYDVSAEAISIRLVNLTRVPCTLFVASRRNDTDESYKVDYSVPSATSTIRFDQGHEIPEQSLLSQCGAIGYTAKGLESWPGSEEPIALEGLGIPPFPNSKWPRVVGIARLRSRVKGKARGIRYLRGNALEPRGTGERILAHIVNDKTPNWGGAGFPIALKKKWPQVQVEFKNWAESEGSKLSLSNYFLSTTNESISVFHMIAQHGYGPSPNPRIRYSSLKTCLEQLAAVARERKATVHMPRIGTGEARGSWLIIGELILDSLVRSGVDVTVYDLQNTGPSEQQGDPLYLFS